MYLSPGRDVKNVRFEQLWNALERITTTTTTKNNEPTTKCISTIHLTKSKYIVL